MLQKAINDEFNINIGEKFNQQLYLTMDYVRSNVSNEPPNGMSLNKYIELMNKKVLNVCLPEISKNINNQNNQNTYKNNNINKYFQEQEQTRNGYQNYTFDNTGMPNEQFDPVLEPPQMTGQTGDLEEAYSQMHSMREDQIPDELNPQKMTQNVNNFSNQSMHSFEQVLQERGLELNQKPKSQINEFFEKSNNLTNINQQNSNLVENYSNITKSLEEYEQINNKLNDKVKIIETENTEVNNNKENLEKIIPDKNINPVVEDFNISISTKEMIKL